MSREKATLAVLFADVSDSMRLYEKLGDTAAFTQIKECLQSLTEATRQFEGWVIKTIGDGIMCAFPNADAAAAAACEMQMRIARWPAPQPKEKLSIRIGFHYGNVLRDGQDVFGDTVNIAARIAGIATASRITITGVTVSKLAPGLRSRVRKLTALPVKGKEHAIEVHELNWQEGGTETYMPGRASKLSQMADGRLHVEHLRKKYLVRTVLTAGRDSTNDIVIEDSMVSRNHLRIEKRKDKFVLIDQSSNGTYVTITGRDEIALRREEFVLYGDGQIALGDGADRPAVATLRFSCEFGEAPRGR